MTLDIEKLRELLAKATPELLDGTATVKSLSGMLRRGAAVENPRAHNWDQVDYEADAAAILGALHAIPSLLAQLEADRVRIGELEKGLEAANAWFARALDGHGTVNDRGCDWLNEDGWEQADSVAGIVARSLLPKEEGSD